MDKSRDVYIRNKIDNWKPKKFPFKVSLKKLKYDLKQGVFSSKDKKLIHKYIWYRRIAYLSLINIPLSGFWYNLLKGIFD